MRGPVTVTQTGLVDDPTDITKVGLATPLEYAQVQLRPWGWDATPISDDDVLYENEWGHLFVCLGDIRRDGKPPISIVQKLDVGHRPSHLAYFGKTNGGNIRRPMWYKPQQGLPRIPCPAYPYGIGVFQGPEIEYAQVDSIGDLIPIGSLMIPGKIPAEYWKT